MMPKTTMIYLIGKPGTGKYTIAKELAKSGYVVCDNQLVNNPIFTLLNYDGFGTIPDFAWDTIKRIRDSVFDFMIQEECNNYILTNVLNDDPGDRALFKQVKDLASQRSSLFVPVKLLISEEEHIKRIQQPERLLRYKSISVDDVYADYTLLQPEHPHLLEFDVSELTAQDAAHKVLAHVEMCAGRIG